MKVTAKDALHLIKWFWNIEEENDRPIENLYYNENGCSSWFGQKTNIRGERYKIQSFRVYDEYDSDDSVLSEQGFLRYFKENGFEVDEYYVRNYVLGLKDPDECV